MHEADRCGLLAACHLLQLLGVPGALHRDLRGVFLDVAQIIGLQFASGSSGLAMLRLKRPQCS